VRKISCELNVNNTSLAALENDVLQLLYVPIKASKDCKNVSKHAYFIEVSYGHLAKLVSISFFVHTIGIVNDTLRGILFDYSHGFLTNGCFTLLGRGTNMMASIYTRVLSNRVSKSDLLSASGLSIEDISAKPEILVGLEVGKQVLLINNSATRGI
jgi:hypothetical protein